MLAIDDTRLSSHSGNAAARPLYFTLGNFSNIARRTLKRHAWTLISLLPIMVNEDSVLPIEKNQFNHLTLDVALRSLRVAEHSGMNFKCSDGLIRKCNPVPAQCVVDLLECYTLAAIPSKSCAQCLVDRKDMNDIYTNHVKRCSERYKDRFIDAFEANNQQAMDEIARENDITPILVIF